MMSLYVITGIVGSLCLFWGVWGSNYFLSTYRLSGVAEILPSDMAYVLFAVAIPIILLLMLIVVAYMVMSLNQNKQALAGLLQAQNKNMVGIQSVGKALIEVRKIGFTNQFFITLPVIFNEISQNVADIISRVGIASDVVLFDALSKEGDSRLYAVCKIILNKREATPHFDESLRRLVKKDEQLLGIVSIFLEHYNKLIDCLEQYDVDHFVLRLIEEGELGRVRAVFNSAIRSAEEGGNTYDESTIESKSFLG